MKTTRTLSIVVPVYFNQESLPHLFEKLAWLENEIRQWDLALELIFVDDGSKDESWPVLTRYKQTRPATKLVRLSRNFGAVAASNTGFQFVTGDCFMILSADLQEPIEQVQLMVKHWVEGERFVISVRAGRKDPIVSRAFASVYYAIVTRLVLETYPKGGFDLMLMDKVMLPFMQRSSAHTNPNMLAYWLGFKPVVLPYVRGERKFGKSRWTFAKKFKFFVDTVTGFSVAPIRFVSFSGMITAAASFLYGIWIAVNALLGRIDTAGFSTVVVLLSFFSGLILFSLGIIGEYLWRIFDLVAQKPKSVIAEVLAETAQQPAAGEPRVLPMVAEIR